MNAIQPHVQAAVDAARCDGCGACAAACPAGAIALRGGLAVVDAARCDGCQACVPACPRGALYAVVDAAPPATALPAPAARGGLARWAARALPAVGAAAALLGREVLLRAADALLARWACEPSAEAPAPPAPSAPPGQAPEGPTPAGGGPRHRRRGHA